MPPSRANRRHTTYPISSRRPTSRSRGSRRACRSAASWIISTTALLPPPSRRDANYKEHCRTDAPPGQTSRADRILWRIPSGATKRRWAEIRHRLAPAPYPDDDGRRRHRLDGDFRRRSRQHLFPLAAQGSRISSRPSATPARSCFLQRRSASDCRSPQRRSWLRPWEPVAACARVGWRPTL